MVQGIKYFGGNIFQDDALIKHERQQDHAKGITTITTTEYNSRVRDKMMAVGYLKRANKQKY